MSEDERMSGGCACGAIRYSTPAQPSFSFFCQCSQCQKLSGSGHSAAFIAVKSETKVTGDLKFWERTTTRGHTVSQGFCPNCGTPIMNENTGFPDALYINAGSLDEPENFQPERVLFADEALPWDIITLPEYAD